MKWSYVILLVLILGGLLAWFGRNEFGGGGEVLERDEQPSGAAPPARTETPGDPSPDADPTLAGTGDAGRTDDGTSAAATERDGDARPEVGEGESLAAAVLYAGTKPDGWDDAEPAQRPHAIRPPKPRGPRMGPGGSGGRGPSPTGHWSRFPPPLPPQGDAAIAIVVRDSQGERVPGADLYLGPPETWKQPAVSFGDLRRIGKTNPKGELEVERLPAGAAALAGNVMNQLNGPRGLDMRSSIPVLLLSGRTVRAEVTLPLDLGGYGRITGRVIDEKDRPIASAAVITGYVRVYADKDGRFEMATVPEGTQILDASRNGYAPNRVEVDVKRGESADVEIVLPLNETGGLVLEGRVLTATGSGLEGASLYLIDVKGRGTLRSIRSGPNGDYRFEQLPDRLKTAAVRVQAGKHTEGYPAKNVVFEGGLPVDRLDIHLPPQRVKVVFRLRDAGTGEAITRMRIEPKRLDEESTARGFTGRSAAGDYEHWFDAGRYRFTVEAPDHETKEVEVDLPRPGERVEVDVDLMATRADGVPVTLRVTVLDAVTGGPVTACTIDLRDPGTGQAGSLFTGASEDGLYSLPASSGRWTLRVQSKTHETEETTIDLAPEQAETDVEVHVRPR